LTYLNPEHTPKYDTIDTSTGSESNHANIYVEFNLPNADVKITVDNIMEHDEGKPVYLDDIVYEQLQELTRLGWFEPVEGRYRGFKVERLKRLVYYLQVMISMIELIPPAILEKEEKDHAERQRRLKKT